MPLNSLEKSQKYLDIILDLFTRASITDRLNSESQQCDWNDHGDTLKILLLKTSGMGDYSRDTGYPQGTIEAVWESIKLSVDRGVRLSLDRADNVETLGLTIGRAAQHFVDHQMAPELDAFRFAKYAATGVTPEAPANLNKDTILDAFDKAKAYMNKKNVPRSLPGSDFSPIALFNDKNRAFSTIFTLQTP